MALSESLYGDTSLRVCGDLDILVPRSPGGPKLSGASAQPVRGASPGGALIRLPLGNAIEYGFTRSDGPIDCRVELHWGLFCGSCNDETAAAEIWRESKPAIFFGATARRLPPEWELLYLAAHAARHRCEGLKWLADIHDTASLRPFDWERMSDAARRHGWASVLGLSLGTCNALLGTAVPPQFTRSEPNHLVWQTAPSLLKTLGDPLFIFHQLKGARNKLSFLFRRAFLPNFDDYSTVHLPHSLCFLYYLLRPVRLTGRCGFQLLRFVKTRRHF